MGSRGATNAATASRAGPRKVAFAEPNGDITPVLLVARHVTVRRCAPHLPGTVLTPQSPQSDTCQSHTRKRQHTSAPTWGQTAPQITKPHDGIPGQPKPRHCPATSETTPYLVRVRDAWTRVAGLLHLRPGTAVSSGVRGGDPSGVDALHRPRGDTTITIPGAPAPHTSLSMQMQQGQRAGRIWGHPEGG